MTTTLNRRHVLAGLPAVVAGLHAPAAAAEPPLETMTVRLPWWVGTSYCWAGAYIAGELMRAEGFMGSEVRAGAAGS